MAVIAYYVPVVYVPYYPCTSYGPVPIECVTSYPVWFILFASGFALMVGLVFGLLFSRISRHAPLPSEWR